MKHRILFLSTFIFTMMAANAQTGSGSTMPDVNFNVRGSFFASYRIFTTSSFAGSDNVLSFTGTTAATLTLPSAATCSGRVYWIKNESPGTAVLTIGTALFQTIGGLSSWILSGQNEAVSLVSNGTNWSVTAPGLPERSGDEWISESNASVATKINGKRFDD